MARLLIDRAALLERATPPPRWREPQQQRMGRVSDRERQLSPAADIPLYEAMSEKCHKRS
jgi:hypothetical protein